MEEVYCYKTNSSVRNKIHDTRSLQDILQCIVLFAEYSALHAHVEEVYCYKTNSSVRTKFTTQGLCRIFCSAMLTWN